MNFAVWILFIALLIAFASAAVLPEQEYLPPVVEEEEQIAAVQPLEESAALAEDGYRYKTVKKLRHRRDVSHLIAQGTLAEDGYHYHAPMPSEPLMKISKEYLPPPVEETTESKEVSEAPSQVSNEYLPPSPPAEEEVPEVKESSPMPEISREYLPPSTEAAATLDVPKFAANEELPSPLDDAVIIEGPSESSVLADDGYHYRRIRYRRDVSELVPSAGYSYETPANVASEYIPPAEVKEAVAEPTSVDEEIVKEYLPPAAAEIKEAPETAELANDGYRYKTVRKLKYRQRRDVSEIVAANSQDQEESVSEASVEYLPPAANEDDKAEVKQGSEIASEAAELAEDGYRYKTIRKVKYRQRRDVSEIIVPESAVLEKDGYHYRVPEPTQVIPKISNEYLPPSLKLQNLPEEPIEVPSTEAPIAVTESTSTVIPESTTVTTEAAPVVTEATTPIVTEAPSTTPAPVSAVSNEYLPPAEEAPLVKVADEVPSTTAAAPIVSNQYLPPVEEIAQIKEAPETPVEETAVLADDGYHYKVGKRFRFRRDVSEIVATPNTGYAYEAPAATNEASNIYLPPAELKEAASSEAPQVANEYLPPTEELKTDEVPEESAVLADDGYHYKTVRRLKYRTRRDVSEIASPDRYLYQAPVAEEESAPLADDGYRYKTVRRLKYRHRRDVSELVAPTDESAILSEDGYHYKTPSTAAPRVANEYLPPTEDVPQVKEAINIEPTIAPEIPEITKEYLPPSEATPKESSSSPIVSNEYLPPTENLKEDAEIVELPQESAVLADDGYHYKTVRRIRYRHRRDVSELANQQADGYTYNAPVEVEAQEIQYLPPMEEVAQVKEAPEPETASLADDGYRYKTVRRLRYRHRV